MHVVKPLTWPWKRTVHTRPAIPVRRHAPLARIGCGAVESAPPVTSKQRINLRVLYRLTRLSPAQALVIGADLVGEISALHSAGQASGGFGAEQLWVDTDGIAGFEKRPYESGPTEEAAAADLLSVHALLVELADQARRPGAPDGTCAVSTLDRAAVAIQLGEELRTVEETMRSAVDTVGASARAELTEMAARTCTRAHSNGRAAPLSTPPTNPAPTSTPPTTKPADRSTGHGRITWERCGKWAMAAVALVAVLVLELVLLGPRIRSDLDALRAAGRPAASQAVSTARPARPVTPPAPAQNGPIKGVDLRPLARCAPGAACAVSVLVRLAPAPVQTQVRWSYSVTDRCTGSVRSTGAGTVTVAPNGQGFAVVDLVTLPPTHAVGVTAVVSTPARAASPPLLVPVDATC
jgi:hypothetical protein